jgi:predicted short-subunit dehydrogenase-like oxidoreductase (DUF2520 family)
MRLVIIGPGRAGGSLALAAVRAGHEIAGVVSRRPGQAFGPDVSLDDPLPDCDVVFIAVRDDDIPAVVEGLVPVVGGAAAVAHLSGFVPVAALSSLQRHDVSVGGFHPLQSLPDPETGAEALRGSYVGIDGDPLAVDTLVHLADTLGMVPFRLEDPARPAYHAAAAASSNFVVTSLAVAADLFAAAGVGAEVVRPLVERVVANVFEKGAEESLTGPISRGDIETVVGHLAAAHEVSEEVGTQFSLMAEATAIRAGRAEDRRKWR